MGVLSCGSEIQLAGPDDVQLVIRPASNHFNLALLSRSPLRPPTDCQVWTILNGAPRSLPQIQLEISIAQTFDDRKLAFREPVIVGFRWPALKDVGAGDWTNPAIFLWADGDHLRLSDSDAHVLHWPNGDKSVTRRWRLLVKVTGLSVEWPIELDLRWTPATNSLELTQCCDTTSADRIKQGNGSESRPPSAPPGCDPANNKCDFIEEARRVRSIAEYRERWSTGSWKCSEASLARTARVDPADLSKWKKGSLPVGSGKARRIERVLKNNERPTPANRANSDL